MKRNYFIQSILLTLAFLSVSISAQTQTGGTIRGTVKSELNDGLIANVTITITQLKRSVQTDENGAYQFTDVPAGRYTIVTHTDGFSDKAQTVNLTGSATLAVDFNLSLASLREEVTVTASGTEQSTFESFQSVNALSSTRLREQASTGIGDVLEREAGVGKRSFGPGTSRPVIRGFDGDRVLVLQDGVRNGSLGSQSGDHGEPIDVLNLERLEVIKGPATLLYGSNAIGGVVNAITNDENDPHEGFRGNFTFLGGTINGQGGTSGGIEYGYKKFLFNVNGNFLREGDFNTPLGRIPNSAARSYGGASSVGYYSEKFFVNGFFNFDRRRYGVPYTPLFEDGSLLSGDCETTEKPKLLRGKEPVPCEYDIYAIRDRFSNQLPPVPDEEVDLRMKRNNYRVRGGFRDLKGAIPQADFSLDFSGYRHEEIETADGIDSVATNFFNDVFSYRAVFQQAKYKQLSGRFGFEGYRRSYLTTGAEQLVDGRVRQNNFAAFALEEITFDRVALQFGGRIENNRYRPTNAALYDERDFTGLSLAAAIRVRLWEGASIFANFTSSKRSPSLEELYNFGAHVGTVTFEVGNQNLKLERSRGIELSFKQKINRVRIDGSFFYYRINDFVYLAAQDADGDGAIDVANNLPIGNYLQDNSRYIGADITVDVDINKYLSAFLNGDVVNAKLRGSNIPLPRITPARIRTGVDFRRNGLSVRPEAVFAFRKSETDVYPLETPTNGYGLFNVNASYTIGTEHYAHIFTFSALNLTDKLYRNHLSFIKDLAPEAGRGVRLSYTFRFF